MSILKQQQNDLIVKKSIFTRACVSFSFSLNSITYIHLPVGSKWLYVGTEKGNIHIVNTESFTLSGYTIHWNKAVEL